VAIAKRLLWESLMLSPAEVGRRETELNQHLMGRSDAIEGVMAWPERRTPQRRLSPTKARPEWPAWPDQRKQVWHGRD